MARTHINFRTWAALILLGALIPLFASLGNWQMNRAAQRDAIHADIVRAAQMPPISLDALTSEDDLTIWRHAQARGHWLHRYTVLLQNRNYQTRPGYWVATPLQLRPDARTPSADAPAILVLRGWLARDDITRSSDGQAAQIRPDLARELAQPAGEQAITGELFAHVPRLLELWSWSSSDQPQLPDGLGQAPDSLPAVQNLDLEDYTRATGLELLPVVLAQTSPDLSMVQDWPHPSSDSDTNRGYALQWFVFCAIAAGAWVFIGWRAVKQARQVSL